MPIGDYIRRIAKRWRIILITATLVIGLVALFTFLMKPTYESQSKLFLSATPQSDLMNNAIAQAYAQQQVLSYSALASSERMGNLIASDLGLDISGAEIASKITTNVGIGTVIIDVTVSDTDQNRVVEISNSLIQNFNSLIKDVDQGNKVNQVKVSSLQESTIPTEQASPSWPLNLFAGGVIGLLLGLAIAALRDLLDQTVRDHEDVERANTSIAGEIPMLPNSSKNAIFVRERGHIGAESIRQLRLNLAFASLDDSAKMITVTSIHPEDGKTTLAANLAATFAQSGSTVILIDGDLRRPQVDQFFEVDGTIGLTNVLLGRIDLDSALQQTVVPNLRVLTAGLLPRSPADVLASEIMAVTLTKIRNKADVIIIDTPPVLLFSDAGELTRKSDGVLVVANYGKTKISELDRAVRQLTSVGGRVIGVVLNRSPAKALGNIYAYNYSSPKRVEPKRKR